MSNVIDSYPLSPLQEGMLFNALFAPHSGVDITQIICRMHHSLDVAAFERAWRDVVARHAILRTGFKWEGLEEPLQEVHAAADLEFVAVDLDGLGPAEQNERFEAHLAADRKRGFDISAPPLIRVAVFRLSAGENILVWPLHHLILDAHSFALVLKEVFIIYETIIEGSSVLLRPAQPYRKYIEWLQEQDSTAAEHFWRELLKGYTAPISLSIAHDPRQLSKIGRIYGKKEILLPPRVREVLKPFAMQNGFTLYTCFQAAWSIILSRYSGSEDVVFASVRGCRGVPIEDASSIIGMFINTLPVRAKVDEAMPLIEFLKGLRAQHVETRAFEHSSLVKIHSWSEIPRGMSIFESLVSYESSPWSAQLSSLGGKYQKREWEVLNQTNIPIGLDVYEEPETRIVVDYDLGMFDAGAMEAMLGHYGRLLGAMVENPDRAVGDLPMLTEGELKTILVDWNRTGAEYPREATIHSLFEARVKQSPDAAAVVVDDVSITYRDLNSRANRLAHLLRKLGVGPDTPVAVCLGRGIDLVTALLGVLKSGGAYVPMDPSYPPERLAFMLEDTNAPVLVTDEVLSKTLAGHKARAILMDAGWDEVAAEPDGDPAEGAGPENLAYVIYTSGSTGLPKGVCVRHESVVNLFADFDRRKPIEPDSRCSLWTSVSFDVSVYEIFTALLAGGTLHIASDAIRFDSAVFIEWLAANRISSAYVPPLMVKDLHSWAKQNPGRLNLGRLLVGVEPINEKLLAEIMETVPGLAIINGYGPTEATICATLYDVRPDTTGERNTPIGKPVQNSRVLLLDHTMRPVPIGIAGEVLIGGKGLARDYLNRPELTAEKFVPDPFGDLPGGRLYKTGDTAKFLADGNIEFIGRRDNQVKMRGFRVELGEIEFTLRRHEAVRDAVVVAKEDRAGINRLVAYIVPGAAESAAGEAVADGRTAVSPSELRNFLREKLPDYMVPTAYVAMDSFPLTPNGKLDKAALPEPEITRADISSSYVAPRTEIEMQLSQIWEKVIGIKPIGVTDNFFDLGGHSLLAVRLFTEIARVFGTNIPLAAIFQSPTIGQVAAMIGGSGAARPGGSLVAIQPTGAKPPLFFTHAYGGGVFFYRELSDHLGTDQPLYGLQAVGIDGKERPHGSVEEMAAHYIDAIKTVQPKGPYYLGGRCLGAYVAFEMASQLRRQGERIALLAILDSYWAPPEEAVKKPRVARHMKKLATGGFNERVKYLSEHAGNRMMKTKLRLARIASDISFRMGRPVPLFMKDFYVNYLIPHANMKAERRYAPPVYSGLITFFQATAEIERDPRLFWGRLTSEGVEVHMVPSTHKDILVEPNVHVLAERMEKVLEKARSEA